MPVISFVAHDGTTSKAEAPEGTSVMQAAMSGGISGIVGECGGSMMCATCHVYVREPWAAKLAPVDATEDAMLTMTVCERRANSRLSCQIIMRPTLDGITVDLPEKQV